MSSIDMESIRDGYDKIEEVYEEIGTWHFTIKNCNETLKIKVFKLHDGSFYARPNMKIQKTEQEGPYMSAKTRNTVQRALRASLVGFLGCWDPSIPDEIDLYKTNDF